MFGTMAFQSAVKARQRWKVDLRLDGKEFKDLSWICYARCLVQLTAKGFFTLERKPRPMCVKVFVCKCVCVSCIWGFLYVFLVLSKGLIIANDKNQISCFKGVASYPLKRLCWFSDYDPSIVRSEKLGKMFTILHWIYNFTYFFGVEVSMNSYEFL